MRTKALEGLLRLDIARLDVKPEFVMLYDGLGGISQRPFLRDLIEELYRKGPDDLKRCLAAIRQRGAATVWVYFLDYVSYGIGGGDATTEFFLATYQLIHRKADDGPERLLLFRPSGPERLSLEGLDRSFDGPSTVTSPPKE